MVLSKRADKLYLNAIMHSKLIWRLLLCLLQKYTNVCPVYFSNCIFSDRRHNTNHKLLLLTPARLFAFLLHYNERMMVPFIIKQQYEGKNIWFEPRRTRVCIRESVCFVYGNDALLIGRVGYLSRSLQRDSITLQPSDRPHFRPLPLSSFYLEERKWKDGILRSPHCLVQEGGHRHFFEVFSRQMRMLQFINLRPERNLPRLYGL